MRSPLALGLFAVASLGSALIVPARGSTTPAPERAGETQPPSDPRARFGEIFCAVEADHGARFPYDRPCDQALHLSAGGPRSSGRPVYLGPARIKLRIVLVPGILGECVEKLATPFEDAIAPLARLGWTVQSLKVSGRSGSAANAQQIRNQIRALGLRPDEKLVLVGYSKGMSDILELLGSADEGVIPDGSSIVSVTGVVRGTPIADRSSRTYRAFRWLPVPGCAPGDGRGVESLTRSYRLAWLASHHLPSRLHYYSLPAYTDRSHVSRVLRSGWSTLARIDPRNDGQVIASDAVIPGGQLLGFANSDHWALVLPFALKAPRIAGLFATRNDYPRVVLLESLARYLEEQYLRSRQVSGAAHGAAIR
jgi:hypothetical protein